MQTTHNHEPRQPGEKLVDVLELQPEADHLAHNRPHQEELLPERDFLHGREGSVGFHD